MSTSTEPARGVEKAMQIGLTANLTWLAAYLNASSNLFATDQHFAYMARLAPERVWAVLFLLAANVGAIGVLTRRFGVKLASVLLIATVHGVFALSLIIAAAGVWSGTFVVIAGMGYYLSYRLARAAPRREMADARPRQ